MLTLNDEFPYYGEFNTLELPREVLYADTYKGHKFFVYNHGGSFPTAYVEVKPEDNWYDKDYNDINIPSEYCPHGGFTYSDFTKRYDGIEAYYIGWDYGHYGDYMSYGNGSLVVGYDENAKRWKIGEIVGECKKVIDYMEKIDESFDSI